MSIDLRKYQWYYITLQSICLCKYTYDYIIPTHRHIQLCVWNHWQETNLCLTRRSAAMSSAFFSMPLGQSLFRPTPDYPSPKRMESNSMPPENEPNKWKSCWYQGRLYFDSSVFCWASQSIWIWWSDWWMLDLLLNLYFHDEPTINTLAFWKYL